MKTKATFIMLWAFLLLTLNVFSQAPQKFNYQAVVRDDAGNLVSEQPVSIKISILQGTVDGTVVYSETHSPTTNSFGLVTLEIGGGTVVSGDLTSVDWGSDTYYMKVEMDATGGTSYAVIGASQLLSVPYALNAETVNELKKLDIIGDENAPLDSALFEVKRSDGQTVFAVYNEGVRVYVDDSNPKGTKGGFAVGGIRPGKGVTNEFFRVTPDSIRMYINDEGAKGTKGGFAIGGFSPVKGLTGDYMNVSGKETAEVINPSEPRVLWYPNKEAFLAGRVLIESPGSVGRNSMAIGFESKAMGGWSQALGFKAIARGKYSTAIGKNAIANSENSFAFGNEAIADSIGTYAFGRSAKASGDASFAFGRNAIASGTQSFAFGSVSVDSVGNPTDVNTQAIGDYSFAFGQGAKSTDWGAFAIGTKTQAQGVYSLSMGYATTAIGYGSVAMGQWTHASNDHETAIGFANGFDLTGNRIFSVGNGDWEPFGPGYVLMRQDAFAVYKNGSVKIQDYLSIGNSGPITENWWEFGIDNGNGTGIDFHSSDNPTCDYSARIYRHPGSNNAFEIANDGQGDIWIHTTGETGVGDIWLDAKVGIGVSDPNYKLEVSGDLGIVSRANLILQDNIAPMQDPGDIIFMGGPAQYARIYAGIWELILTTQSDNYPNLRIDADGQVHFDPGLKVKGTISQAGDSLSADYVFESEYKLESIEQHSEYMWLNKHLPAVPVAVKDENGNDIVEWGERSRGVLEELEKAHVYIDQLNTNLKKQQAVNENQQKLIEQLKQEIDKLKEIVGSQ